MVQCGVTRCLWPGAQPGMAQCMEMRRALTVLAWMSMLSQSATPRFCRLAHIFEKFFCGCPCARRKCACYSAFCFLAPVGIAATDSECPDIPRPRVSNHYAVRAPRTCRCSGRSVGYPSTLCGRLRAERTRTITVRCVDDGGCARARASGCDA